MKLLKYIRSDNWDTPCNPNPKGLGLGLGLRLGLGLGFRLG